MQDPERLVYLGVTQGISLVTVRISASPLAKTSWKLAVKVAWEIVSCDTEQHRVRLGGDLKAFS